MNLGRIFLIIVSWLAGAPTWENENILEILTDLISGTQTTQWRETNIKTKQRWQKYGTPLLF